MCGLFGFMKTANDEKNYKELLNALAQYSSERGTHATGISYNNYGRLVTYKKPLSAYDMTLEHYDGVRAVMGHTRHATHGKPENNYNNHPFFGAADKKFALAHNGILYNDEELKRRERLPKTKILTDSYVMVQLIEKTKRLNISTITDSVELLQGTYTFTILDEENTLYIVKGDSPLHIIKLTDLNLIVYASTEELLYKSILDAGLFRHITNKHFEVIPVNNGEILKIESNGKITRSRFTQAKTTFYYNWYDFGTASTVDDFIDSDTAFYIQELKDFAKYQGYDPEIIDALLSDGFTTDEIEEMLYCSEYGNGVLECI